MRAGVFGDAGDGGGAKCTRARVLLRPMNTGTEFGRIHERCRQDS